MEQPEPEAVQEGRVAPDRPALPPPTMTPCTAMRGLLEEERLEARIALRGRLRPESPAVSPSLHRQVEAVERVVLPGLPVTAGVAAEAEDTRPALLLHLPVAVLHSTPVTVEPEELLRMAARAGTPRLATIR